MGKIIIAIDGVSGSGKSTTAKAVARELGYTYIDTGAMYRAVTLFFIQQEVNLSDPAEVDDALDHLSIEFQFNPTSQTNEIILNDEMVEDQIRSMEVSQLVSTVSALPDVREAMRVIQQELGRNKGVVMDGRDIGTAIFPQAELKVFLNASVEVRAQRRELDFKRAGEQVDLEEIKRNLRDRDHLDSTRETSPLTKAPDAHEIDTSNITLEQQIEQVVALAHQTIDASP